MGKGLGLEDVADTAVDFVSANRSFFNFAHVQETVTDVNVDTVGQLGRETAADGPGKVVFFLFDGTAPETLKVVLNVGHTDTGHDIGRKHRVGGQIGINV